jgi:hypothetical protein
MRNINCMAAGESTFDANAMEEEEHGRLIASSLDNLANASIQKNLTINSLVAINAQLMQALADIQIAIACMSPPVNAPLYSGTILAWGPNPRSPRPHRRHLALPWQLPSLSAYPTGMLSNQTGTRWDTVGRLALG